MHISDYEFCGFFWGDGCLMIQKIKSHSKKNPISYYRPVIKMTQREDDREMMEWCQKRFGGWINKRKATMSTFKHKHGYWVHPRINWEVVGFKKVKNILDVLDKGTLPSKKKKEVKIMKKFIKTQKGIGRTTTPKERKYQEILKQKLHRLKKYIPQK